jgi:hypothetical protein
MEQTLGSLRKGEGGTRSALEQDKRSKLLLENVLARHETGKFHPISKVNIRQEAKD